VPTVRDFVRSNFPETYLVLTERWDGGELQDVVGQKIDATMSYFFPEGQDEDELTDFQRSYVADYATRLAIRPAIDYYMVRTGQSDDLEPRTSSQVLSQRGPGTGRRNYDRIATLRQLDEQLKESLSLQKAQFDASIVPDGTTTSGLMVSTADGEWKTLDPQVFPKAGTGSGRIPRLPPWSWPDWGDQDTTTWPP
jgi:hypothetical protein